MRGMERAAYPSDLSDQQWALIEPMITAWKHERVKRTATGGQTRPHGYRPRSSRASCSSRTTCPVAAAVSIQPAVARIF
ncbi:hypothetical protein SAMN06272765_7215 [Streptomyces sp. Ag109_G2-15]|nr:hypothetical protein SAMN06272765_7215 [Streptomyces sp. Ag109_G2-15]